MRRRRGTNGDGSATDTRSQHEPTNFAQRLLMANEMAVTNIADLWVAAAMNVDNEEVFLSDEEMELSEDELESGRAPALGEAEVSLAGVEMGRTQTMDSVGPSPRLGLPRTSTIESSVSRGRLGSAGTEHRNIAGSRGRFSTRSPGARETVPIVRPRSTRAYSTASSQMPSIYSNAGVRAPPGGHQVSVPLQTTADLEEPFAEGLRPISEGNTPLDEQVKAPSAFKQLPFMIILQYGMLALHSTTHDQVFLSYLVS